MKTVSSLLDSQWYDRYKRISKLNIRSSIYDVTDRCNLRCKGCFFFSSNEHKAAAEEKDVAKWHVFVESEMARGVNLDQVWDIVQTALKLGPGVRGVHFQPMAAFGRCPDRGDGLPSALTVWVSQ